MRENIIPHSKELLVTVQVTYSESIAMNVAVNFYLRYGRPAPHIYPEISRLLDSYMRRLNTLIQPGVWEVTE